MRPPEALENSLVTTVVHSHTFKHQPGNVNDALPPFPLSRQKGIFTCTVLSLQHVFPPHFGFLSSLHLIFPTSHRTRKAGAGNKKTDLPAWGHILTSQKFCSCPSFQHFYLLSCPGKNGLDGWQGTRFQPQETRGG